jgi:hypothetical protein
MEKMQIMIPESDKQFIQANIINFETARLGFVKNLHPDILRNYEDIYKRHISPTYVLTVWCSACVLSLMMDLSRWWEANKDEPLVMQTEPQPKKRRARK